MRPGTGCSFGWQAARPIVFTRIRGKVADPAMLQVPFVSEQSRPRQSKPQREGVFAYKCWGWLGWCMVWQNLAERTTTSHSCSWKTDRLAQPQAPPRPSQRFPEKRCPEQSGLAKSGADMLDSTAGQTCTQAFGCVCCAAPAHGHRPGLSEQLVAS